MHRKSYGISEAAEQLAQYITRKLGSEPGAAEIEIVPLRKPTRR
jgi:hypothetical protein